MLVELDSAETMAALAEAEAALADSERQFARSRDLAAIAGSVRVAARSDRSDAERQSGTCRGRASALVRHGHPGGFDGRTGFRRVSVGSVVNPGTVITTLDDSSIIKLDFTVPGELRFHARTTRPARQASTAGLRGRAFEGKVTNLDSRVDPATRSMFVRAEIPNPDGALRPGMFMTVALQGDVVPALIVPEAAIVPEQGRPSCSSSRTASRSVAKSRSAGVSPARSK